MKRTKPDVPTKLKNRIVDIDDGRFRRDASSQFTLHRYEAEKTKRGRNARPMGKVIEMKPRKDERFLRRVVN